MIAFDPARLWPRFLLSDRNGAAVAAALTALLRALDDAVSLGAAQIGDVDRMAEWRLDELAWEMDIGWYDYEAPVAQKRAVVAGVRDTYSRLGTPAGVAAALGETFPHARVQEFWEYGGSAFHFRVLTTDPGDVSTRVALLNRRVMASRSLRSVYDGAVLQGYVPTTGAALHAGTACIGACAEASAGKVLKLQPVNIIVNG